MEKKEMELFIIINIIITAIFHLNVWREAEHFLTHSACQFLQDK